MLLKGYQEGRQRDCARISSPGRVLRRYRYCSDYDGPWAYPYDALMPGSPDNLPTLEALLGLPNMAEDLDLVSLF
jgi:hypothetical protein